MPRPPATAPFQNLPHKFCHEPMARLCRLRPDGCVFLLCDVQEKFAAAIHKFSAVVSGSQRMVGAAKTLNVPMIVTEQYPKGLGHTVSDIDISEATVVRAAAACSCTRSAAPAARVLCRHRRVCLLQRVQPYLGRR